MALTQVSTKGIKDATITNADVNASAAIAKSKIETFVNNNGTTRFITGTNNVNELDAESNLTVNGSLITFSSSTLVVDKSTSTRFLVFFVYLDDNISGGTHFDRINLTSPCKKGSMLIFPPLWTHLHSGLKPIDKPKYIVGSYLHYVAHDK